MPVAISAQLAATSHNCDAASLCHEITTVIDPIKLCVVLAIVVIYRYCQLLIVAPNHLHQMPLAPAAVAAAGGVPASAA
jgi:hypothetical protein